MPEAKTFFCIDAHTCGNPVRVVAGGGPLLSAGTIGEKRLEFIRDYDWIRRGLMFEPRGHDMMSGSILYPPVDARIDAAILFIETSGCLPMCGHGTIGTVTVAIEQGLIIPKQKGELRLETPAGLIRVSYTRKGPRVDSVTLVNIPSYLEAQDLKVECSGLGELRVDIAYGGNFYAIIDPQEHFRGLEFYRAEQLIPWSRELRHKLQALHPCSHPGNQEISGISHIMWTGKPLSPGAHARNAVFYGNRAIDRSPCGTGTSARMAQWYFRGKLQPGEPFIHESIIGSTFLGRISGTCKEGDREAIIPSITGWARITGYHTIFLDPEDPYAYGFEVL